MAPLEIMNFPQNLTPPPSHRNESLSQSRLIKQSKGSFKNLKQPCYITGAATFFKEKRSIQKEVPITPGPGDYSIDHIPVRKKSPSAVFPKEKRVLDIAHKDSPGPSAYTPVTHFQSKF